MENFVSLNQVHCVRHPMFGNNYCIVQEASIFSFYHMMMMMIGEFLELYLIRLLDLNVC